MLSALPEKKAIIYFSSGISKTGTENQSQLRATINAAVRANVSFYPIDVRGLVATPPGGAASETGQKVVLLSKITERGPLGASEPETGARGRQA